MFHRLAILVAAVVLLAATPTFAAEHAPIVHAPAGMLKGAHEGEVSVFKGIPYALPPVGSARWKPPVAMPKWQGIRLAQDFGPPCMQRQAPPSPVNVYWEKLPPVSEDCLTLNVWTSAGAKNAPVFVWIHGGAFSGGGSGDAIYDGATLASRGLIVVTINYRLGIFGWFAHPELSAESPLHVSGNYGLLDQIEALRWIRRNIPAFGGDPANVTIAGESAGGLSVLYLMAAPDARGLFAKAIAESSYMVSVPELKEKAFGLDSAEQTGASIAAKLNAKSLADLRALDATTLMSAPILPLPTVDGQIVPHQLVETFDKGEQAHVPVLVGFNSGEIRSLRILAPQPPASADDYIKAIHASYLDLADDFLKLYPATNMNESILATTRDALYGWTAERVARKQTAIGAPAFLYFFDHSYPAAEEAGLHGFHGSELPFVFGTMDRTAPNWPKIPQTAEQAAFSNEMLDYWASFARTGQPVAANAASWPAFASSGEYMDFTDAPHPSADLLPGMYALDEQVVCRRRASGDVPWNWNFGLVSPPLPPSTAECK